MPSSALKEISDQIERQPTDSFGKFYLYATLLKTLTVQEKAKGFVGSLPIFTSNTPVSIMSSVASKVTTAVKPPKLDVGELQGEFVNKLGDYRNDVINTVITIPSTVQKIVNFFLRKDLLNDLLFIIEKMNTHLKAEPMATVNYNQNIFFQMSFNSRQKGVVQLLEHAERTIKLGHNVLNHSAYGVGTILVAILATKFVFSFGGILLTLGMLAVAGYGAYLFFQSALKSYKDIAASTEACIDIVKNMSEDQASALLQDNNLNFIIRSIVAPVAYLGVTISEHEAFTKEEQEINDQERKKLDQVFPMEGGSFSLAWSKM